MFNQDHFQILSRPTRDVPARLETEQVQEFESDGKWFRDVTEIPSDDPAWRKFKLGPNYFIQHN